MYPVEIGKITAQSMYEFGRAIVTMLVGGMFMFYSFVSGVGVVQSFQSGQFGQALILIGMFALSFGSMVLYVGVINGVLDEPLN